jgi:hypothetical protein
MLALLLVVRRVRCQRRCRRGRRLLVLLRLLLRRLLRGGRDDQAG